MNIQRLKLNSRFLYQNISSIALAFCAAGLLFAPAVASAAPLRVVTTTTDLASIVRSIGGAEVEVKSLANGVEDPHFVEAKPGFIRDLAKADLFIQNGMEQEVGWVPVLLKNCRNRKVLPGNTGFLEAASVIHAIHDKTGEVDRSMGDVHPGGNPHFMVDPTSGILVTAHIGERLGKIRPAKKAQFDQRSRAFQKQIAANLWGSAIAGKYPPVKLARLQQRGGARALFGFLKRQNMDGKLSGWMSQMGSVRRKNIIVEHRFWPYFSKTFGLNVVAAMEPIPGVDPTTTHLKKVVDTAKASGPSVILALPYFPSKHARFVSQNTGAKIARMAHMPRARPGTEDYLKMLGYNIATLTAAAR